MEKIVAYIGLGSNMGDKEANIRQAVEMVANIPGVLVTGVAPLYKTEPLGFTRQDWFLNTVAEIGTDVAPLSLLHSLQEIENKMGRVRTIHWGPRTIDLDMLLYGRECINLPELTVPHPRMGERAFVLVPLSRLKQDISIPGLGKVAEIASELAEKQQVTCWLE
ncbi:2-amino-4-hydroxy-6-hydroxymethyldihydropteridine pyrophosphokinase [Desulfocucumis palustris]|uniref:2-amino-4-hydroxy-6-hydroxymethyldihydropteridine diphosphokinase n=1 Tax=Desulfocucumis palustris TaxID=1898651 RepID=A0A2L2X7Y4_9FIRM|nr:2-amino-4-hydroxy-6-hydroxymethyldihydropteridine diphosphokinase [Desulfocucumis palustris]GBF32120.1 2-amino-4-hydroxy-6-hydroxymethyldihydropteridine pyrophosphokinase [Desulfocucumis palustris]